MTAMTDPRAGQPAEAPDLIDVDALLAAYDDLTPDLSDPAQRVVFGTSGHRGSSLDAAFNDTHILAITQAICEYRAGQGTTGPLFLGKRHPRALRPAWRPRAGGAGRQRRHRAASTSPTATRRRRRSRTRSSRPTAARARLADGIVVTPSHNPPRDGGFKYNPPHGGPADTDATTVIADRANELLEAGLDGVRRIAVAQATGAASRPYDFLGHVRRRPAERRWTSTRSGPPACASAPTRSAARASTTGRRSPNGTGST